MAGKKNGGAKALQRQVVTAVRVQQRQEQAMALRVQGWALREIAAHLGISLTQAHLDIEAVLEESRKHAFEDGARHLAVSLERLDKAIRGIMPKVEEGDARACEVLARLEERRSKFLGLDAATKHEHSGPEGAPIAIDARDALLEKLTGFVAAAASAGAAATADPEPDA